MKVLITGGSGDIGRALGKRLDHQGWELRLIGLEDAPFDEVGGVEYDYTKCDIMDFDALKTQLQGCDAVVHLAALRSPTMAFGQEVFQINVGGTFNVYEAAAQMGIKRVVQASSINAIGCGWSVDEIRPQYLPLDENHPHMTNDPYSFSKQVVEDVAAYFYRRDGISGTSVRFPGVYNRKKLGDKYFTRRETVQNELDRLLNQPEAERKARLEPLKAAALALRKARGLEYASEKRQFTAPNTDPLWSVYAFDRFNYLTSLDDRDAAQAIEKSLGASYEGSHPLFITDACNSVGLSSKKLAELFYPEVTDWKREPRGNETLVSIDEAKALIGFSPEFSACDEI